MEIQVTDNDHELLRSEHNSALLSQLKSFFMKFENHDRMVELNTDYSKFLLGILDEVQGIGIVRITISDL